MGCTSSRSDDEDEDDFLEHLPKERYYPQVPVPSEITATYILRALVGRGAFSEVVRAENRLTREPRAIKIVKKDVSERTGIDSALATELAVLAQVRHPNIVRMYEALETPTHVFIVTELATGGELFDRIQEKGSFDEPYASSIVRMVLSAVAYLHSLGIAHRDLKPENILFYHPGPSSRIMVADFGLSKMSDRKNTLFMNTACGSPEYLAPEVLSGRNYSVAVDMWSIGVITYILLCGYAPFDGPNRNVLFHRIMSADYDFHGASWERVSDSGKDFVEQLLVVDAPRRLTARQAQQHTWIVTHAEQGSQRDTQYAPSDSRASSESRGSTPSSNGARRVTVHPPARLGLAAEPRTLHTFGAVSPTSHSSPYSGAAVVGGGGAAGAGTTYAHGGNTSVTGTPPTPRLPLLSSPTGAIPRAPAQPAASPRSPAVLPVDCVATPMARPASSRQTPLPGGVGASPGGAMLPGSSLTAHTPSRCGSASPRTPFPTRPLSPNPATANTPTPAAMPSLSPRVFAAASFPPASMPMLPGAVASRRGSDDAILASVLVS
eukprot:m.237524 g.237524  ORF g.237524 m.237524 type:complete len:549 (+) comp21167_c0_seq1:144-1790(+)